MKSPEHDQLVVTFADPYIQRVSHMGSDGISAEISALEALGDTNPNKAGVLAEKLIHGVILYVCRSFLTKASPTARRGLALYLSVQQHELDEYHVVKPFEKFLSSQMKTTYGVSDFQSFIDRTDFESLIVYILSIGKNLQVTLGRRLEGYAAGQHHDNASRNDPSPGVSYYAILGISQTASHTEIRDTYRLLASIHHPDKGGSPKFMTMLNRAYAVLSNPDSRASYDSELVGSRPSRPTQTEAPSGSSGSDKGSVDGAKAATVVDQSLVLIAAARQAAMKMLAIGMCWLIGGLVITGIAYNAAPAGGTYIVTWGAILYGAYQILRGLFYLASPSSLIKKVTSK
jgi:DnaJ-like protein